MQRIDTGDAVFIDLIRHGVPVGGRRYRGHRDDPLSEAGWAQMWAAVPEAPPWERIVTSPLTRCRAFAEALGERIGAPVAVEPAFTEISFGEWEGREIGDILAQTPHAVQAYWADPVAATPPGGESLAGFRERVVPGWERLVGGADAHTLVVGHGGLIRMLLAHVLEMPLAAVLRLEVANAGVTRLRLQSDINGRPAPSLVFHARPQA